MFSCEKSYIYSPFIYFVFFSNLVIPNYGLLLRGPNAESCELRAARERIVRSHFLGGLMSFQNLTHSPKWRRRVSHLFFSSQVLPVVGTSSLRNFRRFIKPKKNTNFSTGNGADGFFFSSRNPGTREPLFLRAKAAVFFLLNCNRKNE